MLTRPQLDGLIVKNATNDIKFQIYVGNSSDQVVAHHVEAYNNLNGVLIHQHKTQSFLLECTIPKNTLSNGVEYKVRVRTYNANIKPDFSNENGTNTSAWSDYLIIRCFSDADVLITNIPIDTTGNRLIKNQTFTFSGSYYQKENVGLKSFRYILYDKDKVSLQVYPARYQTGGELEQEVTGLRSNEEYYIELVTLNQYDIENRSALIDFRVDYNPPRISQIFKAENDKENALVKVDAQIIQMLLEGEGDYVFENYSTYTRNRILGEVNTKKLSEVDDMTIKEFTTERMVEKLGTYSVDTYSVDDGSAVYSINAEPSTIQDVFFINLKAKGSKVYIDKNKGLNLDNAYTMVLYSEGVIEDKVFLEVKGKNSTTQFLVYDNKVHCFESYGTMVRHSAAIIDRYVKDRPMQIFIQKRDNYMRLKVEMLI